MGGGDTNPSRWDKKSYTGAPCLLKAGMQSLKVTAHKKRGAGGVAGGVGESFFEQQIKKYGKPQKHPQDHRSRENQK